MEVYTVFTLTQPATTGTVEETLSLSEKGVPIGTSIPVPAGTSLAITDLDVAAGGAFAMFRLKQSNDGVNFFTIGALQVTGTGIGTWVKADPVTAWMITGGPNVQVALTALTTGGPLPVTCVMTGYRTM